MTVALVKPVIAAKPVIGVNVTTLELSNVSTLVYASSKVAVMAQVFVTVIAAGHPLSQIVMTTPAADGERFPLVAFVSTPEAAVNVYCVPTRPPNVQFDTLTTPAAAVNPVQDASVPPEAVKLIEAVDDVTTLPAESSTFTTGCVVSAVPAGPATGWVVKANWLAAPGPVGENEVLGKEVKPPAVAVNV